MNVGSAYDEYTPRGGIGAVGRFGVDTEIGEVTTFEYQVNGGAWQSVPKTPNSLVTDISVTMDRNGANVFSVRGRTEAGEYTPQTDYPFLVGTSPEGVVDRLSGGPVGRWRRRAGRLHLHPGRPRGGGVVEYTIDNGEPATVAANAAGVVTVTYAPTSTSSHTISVRGRTADGAWSDSTNYYFLVDFS